MRVLQAGAFAAATLLVAAASAAAARPLSYQGFTSQGHEISFKRSSAGVFSMKIEIRAACVNDQGQSTGEYDFTMRAVDRVADGVRRGSFRVALAGNHRTPDAVIRGTIDRHGVARGTIAANGRVTDPNNLGSCRSSGIRWTAGP